jgi:hypothetical protein
MFDKNNHSGVHIGPDGSKKNTRKNPWISQGAKWRIWFDKSNTHTYSIYYSLKKNTPV